MERRIKILFWLAIFACLVSLGAIMAAAVSFKKVASLEKQTKVSVSEAANNEAEPQIVPPKVLRGFVGLPNSKTLGEMNGNKIIELRGHEAKMPYVKGVYGGVLPEDKAIAKIIISSNTQITRFSMNGDKVVEENVPFDKFSIEDADGLFNVVYTIPNGSDRADETMPVKELNIRKRIQK
jgi:hypothetical protein